MMNGGGKSDSAIVAGKPTNKAGQPAAESVEPSAEAEGNASQQSTRRAQDRESVSQALERIRQVARQRKKERFTSIARSRTCTPGSIGEHIGLCRLGDITYRRLMVSSARSQLPHLKTRSSRRRHARC